MALTAPASKGSRHASAEGPGIVAGKVAATVAIVLARILVFWEEPLCG